MLDKSVQSQHNQKDNVFCAKISQIIIDTLTKMSNWIISLGGQNQFLLFKYFI